MLLKLIGHWFIGSISKRQYSTVANQQSVSDMGSKGKYQSIVKLAGLCFRLNKPIKISVIGASGKRQCSTLANRQSGLDMVK